MSCLWTVERVRRELPEVPVRFGQAGCYPARCAGRDPYCGLVQLYLPYGNEEIFLELEFPWRAIAAALNGGQALAWETRPRRKEKHV